MRAIVGVGAVEENNAVLERTVGQHAKQVALRFPRLGKNDSFICGPEFGSLGKGDGQSFD